MNNRQNGVLVAGVALLGALFLSRHRRPSYEDLLLGGGMVAVGVCAMGHPEKAILLLKGINKFADERAERLQQQEVARQQRKVARRRKWRWITRLFQRKERFDGCTESTG